MEEKNEMLCNLKEAAKLSNMFGDVFYTVDVCRDEIRLQGRPNPEIEEFAQSKGFIKITEGDDRFRSDRSYYKRGTVTLIFM